MIDFQYRTAGLGPACLLLASLIASGAQAQGKTVTVKAGTTASLGYYTSAWDKNCRAAGLPTVTIVKAPQHGSIDLREEPRPLQSLRHGEMRNCKGVILSSQVVYYSATAGYRGPDSVALSVRSARDGTTIAYRINVSVR